MFFRKVYRNGDKSGLLIAVPEGPQEERQYAEYRKEVAIEVWRPDGLKKGWAFINNANSSTRLWNRAKQVLGPHAVFLSNVVASFKDAEIIRVSIRLEDGLWHPYCRVNLNPFMDVLVFAVEEAPEEPPEPRVEEHAQQVYEDIGRLRRDVWRVQDEVRIRPGFVNVDPAAGAPNFARDLNRDYKDSYATIKATNEVIYIMSITSLEEKEPMVVYKTVSEKGLSREARTLPVSSVNLDIPKLGMVNTSRSSVYLYREPTRQWKKGFNGHIIGVAPIATIRHVPIKLHPDWPQIALCTFNRKFYSPKEALEAVANADMFSCAVNRKIAVSVSPHTQHLCLLYKNYKVGVFKDDRVVVPERVAHLKEEISKHYEVLNK